MGRSGTAKREPAWACICRPAISGHTPEDCAINLSRVLAASRLEVETLKADLFKSNRANVGLDGALREIAQMKDYFGITLGLNEGLKCVCGGPLFNFSDRKDTTRICPFCAARYIACLKTQK